MIKPIQPAPIAHIEPTCDVVNIVDTHTGTVVDQTVVCDTPYTAKDDHVHAPLHKAEDHINDDQHCELVTTTDPVTHEPKTEVVCHDPVAPSAPEAPSCELVNIVDNHTGAVVDQTVVCDKDHSHNVVAPKPPAPAEPSCELVNIVDNHTGAVVDQTVVCDKDHSHDVVAPKPLAPAEP